LGYYKCDIDTSQQDDFFAFLDCINDEQVPKKEKVKRVRSWVGAMTNDGFVNSLAFCLLTGRRATNTLRELVATPFVEFPDDQEFLEKEIEEKSIKEREVLEDDFEDIDFSSFFDNDADSNDNNDDDEDDDFGFGSLFGDDDDES
jgi:hypothetical protein